MHTHRTRLLSASILALTFASATSCATLDQLMKAGASVLQAPKVTFLGAQLVRAPSQLDITAYYCPKVLAENAGLGFAANLLCSKFFGKAPAASDMLVGFDLTFDVANPNQLPLPLSEILTGITVFPDQAKQNLGAVCLALCEPGDASCAGGARSNGCAKAPGDIKSMSDFPQAALNLLLAQGISAAGGKPSGFALPKVTAASNLAVTARLALTPEAFLPALEELARRSVGDLKVGKKLSFDIPYRMEGTVFADAGSLGRVAAGFGPVAGAWPLPTERLLP